MGIQPDVIVCRSDQVVGEELKAKIALFCDVERRGVVPLPTMPSIYEVPLVLEEEGLGDHLLHLLRIPPGRRDLAEWRQMVERLHNPSGRVTIAVIGKYVELHDAYLSVREALTHAGIHHNVEVDIRWVHSELLEQGDLSALEGVHGFVVPGGFGERGIEGKIAAARMARTQGIPYLGLCLGLHMMVIEAARAALETSEAHTTEVAPDTPNQDTGGTMRLGSYPCQLVPGTRAHQAYGTDEIAERHRHRYEVNNAYLDTLARVGLIPSGPSPDGKLVEIGEIEGHPFMVGSQFHPEFRSRPLRPHPLFRDFVGAAFAHASAPPEGLRTDAPMGPEGSALQPGVTGAPASGG
jgi:CTP synthase